MLKFHEKALHWGISDNVTWMIESLDKSIHNKYLLIKIEVSHLENKMFLLLQELSLIDRFYKLLH